MASRPPRVRSFELAPGRVIGGKYVVQRRLGAGWEGEVYQVVERRTGATRAAKVFFPQRNQGDRALRYYARKLERLRGCPLLITYHHSEVLRWRGLQVSVLISELVEGRLLEDFIAAQPRRRLPLFEALHILYGLAAGVETIHDRREYHGDLHTGNVIVRRRGIGFDLKLVDFFDQGKADRYQMREDVVDLIHLFTECLGGRPAYAGLPKVAKGIIRGWRRDLLARSFPTAGHLRRHLENLSWDE
ncbi:MAG: serine/threonine protein kinase [Planctomycetota bacterium]|nr:MAG: serine/threonine protein kinase [Planctomycetota bacterium]